MNPSSQIESIQQSQPYTIIQSLHQQQQDQTNNNHISDQQQSSQSSSTNTSVSPSRERERESRHHSHHHHSHNHNHSHNNHNHNHKHHGGTNGSSSHSSSQQNGGHRNDAERMRKKFRDAIYVGNFERVARIIKNIIENDTLDLSSVLLPYASRHVTPIGLAARRGHVKICKVLVEVIKEYVIKQHAAQQQYDDTGLEQGNAIGMDMVNGMHIIYLFVF